MAYVIGYLQQKAGHSQSAITERYIHAAQINLPGSPALGGAGNRQQRTSFKPATTTGKQSRAHARQADSRARAGRGEQRASSVRTRELIN